tara:strand:+ start:4029 stop:4856 length:828 start_codon:yes stop_codon:yes gene_type:complete
MITLKNYMKFILTNLFKVYRIFHFKYFVPLLIRINHFIIIYGRGLSSYKSTTKKNINNKKSCVIVGTGPSLLASDIEKLISKNIDIIGLNSLICWLDEKKISKIDYYVIQDFQVFEKLKHLIKKNSNSFKSFIGTTIYYKKPFLKNKNFFSFPLHMLDHYGKYFKKPYKTKFSKNPNLVIYDGYTVAYSAVQIAYFLGYTKIYLLGIDAGYSNDVNKRNIININKLDPTFETAGERINYSLNTANNFLIKKNISLINLTRGGNLEGIKRENLDKI